MAENTTDMFAFAHSESSYSESSEDCSSEGSNPEHENTETAPNSADSAMMKGINGGASNTVEASAKAFPGCPSNTSVSALNASALAPDTSEVIKSAGRGSSYSQSMSSGFQSGSEVVSSSESSLPSFTSFGNGNVLSTHPAHTAEPETTYMDMNTTPAASFKLEPISEILNPLRFPGYAGTGLESWSPLTSLRSCDSTTSVTSATTSLTQYARPAESFHASANQQSAAVSVTSTSPSHMTYCQNVASVINVTSDNSVDTSQCVSYTTGTDGFKDAVSISSQVGSELPSESQNSSNVSSVSVAMETETKVYQDLTPAVRHCAPHGNNCLSASNLASQSSLCSSAGETEDMSRCCAGEIAAKENCTTCDDTGATSLNDVTIDVITTSSAAATERDLDTSSTSSAKSETTSTDDSEDSGLGSDDQNPILTSTLTSMETEGGESAATSQGDTFGGIIKESIVNVSA